MSESKARALQVIAGSGQSLLEGETVKQAADRIQAEPLHISQVDPTRRAIVDAAIRDSLLCIVAQQSGPVTVPLDVLDAMSQTHRLVVEIDRGVGVVRLRAEVASAELVLTR